jgi:hypothetical protein
MTPQEVADALTGKRVLSVRSHPLSGVIIDLGEWRRRRRPVKNDALTEKERIFEGSHSLFLQTELRLDARSDLLVNGRRPEGDDVWLLLDQLVRRVLVRMEFSNSLLALELDFDNDFRLHVEAADSVPGVECYSIAINDVYWIVYGGGRVEESPRKSYIAPGGLVPPSSRCHLRASLVRLSLPAVWVVQRE